MKLPPGPIGSWVRPGTPSAALCSRIPCQCTLVSTGRVFSTRTASTSPALARISLPGSTPPYSQVVAVTPPRSTRSTPTRSVACTAGVPSEGVGGAVIGVVALGRVVVQALSSVAPPSPSPVDSTWRRENMVGNTEPLRCRFLQPAPATIAIPSAFGEDSL